MAAPQVLWQETHAPIGSSKRGTGINHRAAQVGELLQRTGATVVALHVNPAEVSKLQGIATGLRRLWARGLWRPSQLHRVGRHGRRLVAHRRAIAQSPSAACLIWGTPMDWTVPVAAALAGIQVIAMPSDLDAVAPLDWDAVTGRGPYANLRLEVELLKQSSAVFCTAKEEQWLLTCLGVSADWLPYYPPDGLFTDLLQVRARRRQASTRPLLMNSSFSNPANRSGVKHVIALLESLPSACRPKVVLVGYQTDQLRSKVAPEVLDVAGEVNDDHLYDLMAAARAVLIYQHSGTGALTRIPEALVAGVPVICNGVAARSAHHYDGVYTFETAGELAELLARDLPTPPVPPRPVAAEQRFIATVRRVAGLPS